ncbi:hypothetical protein [Streptomyces sp. URMC 124]|uniref:hypothetical protein n=1 Tax=Streptomyces sp. URMC 124 TaxID=3423405 RepID=UPI003F1E2F6B
MNAQPAVVRRSATEEDRLRALLVRLITDGAHHNRCAGLSRIDEGRIAHDAFAAAFHIAALYTANLLTTGTIQAHGGHRPDPADQAAAEHLADNLPDDPAERASSLGAIIRPHVASPKPASGHQYLSTGCLHDEHGYCQSNTGLGGAKVPAKCKWCAAQCICPCHAQGAGDA